MLNPAVGLDWSAAAVTARSAYDAPELVASVQPSAVNTVQTALAEVELAEVELVLKNDARTDDPAADQMPLRSDLPFNWRNNVQTEHAKTARAAQAVLPALHSTAKLPKTELTWGDYRLTFMRAQQRLNIEHQLTGEYGSVFLQDARAVGDWTLQALSHEPATQPSRDYQLLGTPFYLQLSDTEQAYCVVEVAEYGLQLVLR